MVFKKPYYLYKHFTTTIQVHSMRTKNKQFKKRLPRLEIVCGYQLELNPNEMSTRTTPGL